MPDPASLVALGLAGLFVAAFLAGSVLPFSSEVVLAGVITLGASPISAVVVATAGNVLGALTVYAVGRLLTGRRCRAGGLTDSLIRRISNEDPRRLARARTRLERWGPVALLLAWVPIIGDVLALAAGMLALPLLPATLYITAGKAARYAALAAAMGSLS